MIFEIKHFIDDPNLKLYWQNTHTTVIYKMSSDFSSPYISVFQTFLSCGTFKTLLRLWRNLDTHNSANLRIFTKPCEKWTGLLGSAEPRLITTAVYNKNIASSLPVIRSNGSGVNYINVLCAPFLHKILVPKIKKLCFGFTIFWHKYIGEKSGRKMLMKLTADISIILIVKIEIGFVKLEISNQLWAL